MCSGLWTLDLVRIIEKDERSKSTSYYSPAAASSLRLVFKVIHQDHSENTQESLVFKVYYHNKPPLKL